MTKECRSSWRTVARLCAGLVIASSASLFADGFFGAIFTTKSNGTTVNQNIYDKKEDVYLNGGPQNQQSQGLPDGTYYFQVTDPSGATLLSTDAAECRQLTVANGVVSGGAGPCPHPSGTYNPANGSTPVQLAPFNATPNNGGEYKVWLISQTLTTSVADNGIAINFQNSDSKTDNFKVQKEQQCPATDPQCKPGEPAYLTVCKFWDKNADGNHNDGEPLLGGWSITASGSLTGDVTQSTATSGDSLGCTKFNLGPYFQTVTLSEEHRAGWAQSAPADGTYSNVFTAGNGVTTIELNPGDDLIAPDFGNHCDGCKPPTAGKTADGGYKKTFVWNISKVSDKTVVKQIGGNATFTYTVSVSHDAGTISDVKVTGTITVTNPNSFAVAIDGVADQLSDTTVCAVTGGGAQSLAPGATTFAYVCTLAGVPQSIDNTVTVSWSDDATNGLVGGSATYKASNISFVENQIDEIVNVTDSYGGTLGPASVAGVNPKTFTYSRTVTVPQFGCQSYDNTARFTANDSGATGSASRTVTACGPVRTGALTIGFWQNKNGQGIITGQAKTGVCASATWLWQYAPFQDLSATATCAGVGTYVTNIIKAANASGSSMNAMLKAQMLATALDTYFSDPALGGNKIGAPAPIGGVPIDLTKISKMIDSSTGTATCSGTYLNTSAAFGGATSLTVAQILAYAASQSNAGGSVWYGQVKATQELAKNVFDAINNQVAFAP
jgi:hypothetical protein